MNAPLSILPPPTPIQRPTIPTIPALELDPRTYDRALSCVHCGLCLPVCPTYTQTLLEADSPRGRIQLMRGLADGVIPLSESVKRHLDLCLDCRGCETACPSNVVYHELIEETRARFASQQPASPVSRQERLMRWLFLHVFTHPTRLKLLLLPARVLQKLGLYALLRRSGVFKLLPARWRKLEEMLPASGAVWPATLPEHTRSGGADALLHVLHGHVMNPGKELAVGFFGGCVGGVLFDKTNRQAVELLAAAGANVLVPRAQVCCGAIHHHNGEVVPAQAMARKNIDTFLPLDGPGVDHIVTNIAGCGAMLKEYDHLLRDDPAYAERAEEFSRRVCDISELLVILQLPAMRYRLERTATYHDACHLAHAQKVTEPPRELLARIPGLKLIPLPESDICCGAAGTYNLTQPEMSKELARRKLDNIARTGATLCITGNVGCAMQIQSEATARGQKLRVVHPVELLHEAVFGPANRHE